MMSTVDIADETPGGAGEPDTGLLGRLPRQRPQNASRRRASARAAAETNGTAPSPAEERRATGATRKAAATRAPAKQAPAKRKPKTAAKAAAKPAGKTKPAAKTKPKTKPKVTASAAKPAAERKPAAKRARSTPKPGAERPPVPPQGYESDGDRAKGIVRPPGGADFAATALEAIGELTRFSLSAGERLVRDVLGRRS